MSKSAKPTVNFLVSYAYWKPEINSFFKDLHVEHKLIIDSGAFTAWKKNKEYRVQDYCNFIKTLPFKPWRYFTLDVIGNPKRTFENYNYMLKNGLAPIPIFTRNDDFDMIDYYYETSDLLALGGLDVNKESLNAIKKAMQKVGDRKIHLLGITDMNYLKLFRPYMCDSSSWSSIARFGAANIYAGNGKTIRFDRSKFKNAPSKEMIQVLNDLKVDCKIFSKKETWKATPLLNIGNLSYLKLMLDLKKYLCVNLFIAAASKSQLEMTLTNFKKLTAENA